MKITSQECDVRRCVEMPVGSGGASGVAKEAYDSDQVVSCIKKPLKRQVMALVQRAESMEC